MSASDVGRRIPNHLCLTSRLVVDVLISLAKFLLSHEWTFELSHTMYAAQDRVQHELGWKYSNLALGPTVFEGSMLGIC